MTPSEKKLLRSRWLDPSFLAAMQQTLSALGSGASLHGPQDLRGIEIGEEGTPEPLQQRNLVGVQLQNVDLSLSRISVCISNASFKSVNFDGATLTHVIAKNAEFLKCSFEKAKLQLNANDAIFEECAMIGATFSSPRAFQEWGGRRVRFLRCDLSASLFRGVVFRASTFEDCKFVGAMFVKCDLRGVKFVGGAPTLEDCLL